MIRAIPLLSLVIGFLWGHGSDIPVDLAPVLVAVVGCFILIAIEEFVVEPWRDARHLEEATRQAEAGHASLGVEAESLFRRENGGPTDWGEVAEMRRGSSFSPNPSANLVGR